MARVLSKIKTLLTVVKDFVKTDLKVSYCNTVVFDLFTVLQIFFPRLQKAHNFDLVAKNLFFMKLV